MHINSGIKYLSKYFQCNNSQDADAAVSSAELFFYCFVSFHSFCVRAEIDGRDARRMAERRIKLKE